MVNKKIKNKEQFDALSLSPTPIVLIDRDNNIIQVNEAALSKLGLAYKDVIEKKCYELLDTDVCNTAECPCKIAMEKDTTIAREGTCHSLGDISIKAYAVPKKDENGKIAGCAVSIFDITEQKRLEIISREAQQYARELIEVSIDPLITISPEGKIMDVNKATELVTGRSRKQIIGTDFLDYFTDPKAARESYQLVFKEGVVRDYPLEIEHIDGTVTPVVYNASVYNDTKGNVAGIFAAARDITELKKLQEKSNLMAKEIMEVSTPIVSIFDEILTLPVIGTLDSQRTQQIMEKLLQAIVDTQARVVIIDITGVPVVDTLTATHLLKTGSAVRLLGAKAIITGISPIIAQMFVNLGVDLSDLTTRSQLADGLSTALDMLGKKIVTSK